MNLVVGIIILLISVAHYIYGFKELYPKINKNEIDYLVEASFKIMYIREGLILIIVGLLHIMLQFQIIELNGIARFTPITIIILNILTFILFAFKNKINKLKIKW